MEKITGKQLTAAILLLAFILRLPEFFISLAYDEIWTLSNFAPLSVRQLLFDLELPNNHPLNSILIKFLSNWDLRPECIRLPNLLAGLLTVWLFGELLKRYYGAAASGFGMLFLSLSAPLAVYSMQARGYSLQLFFLILYAYALCRVGEKEASSRRRQLFGVLALCGALGAMITLPTSVLYLAGITLILWNYHSWQLKPPITVISTAAAGGVALLYILLNIKGLMAARKWGAEIDSPGGFLQWLWEVLYMIVPLTWLPFMLRGIWLERKYLIGSAAALLLIFGSAVFTNGGGARVYLPLIVLAAFYSAVGTAWRLQKLKKSSSRLLFILVVLALCGGSYFYLHKLWKLPNYHPVIAAVKTLPPENLVIYPAGESYPVVWNSNGEAALFYCTQTGKPFRQRELWLVNRQNIISGVDKSYAEKNLPLPFPGSVSQWCGLELTVYKLKAVSGEFAPDRPVIAVLHTAASQASYHNWCKYMQNLPENPADVLLLNCFFSGAGLPDNRRFFGGVWYFAAGALTRHNRENLPEKLAGIFSFYQLEAEQ